MKNTAGPLVSIIIPAYNAERWIRDTLRSAIDQTWTRLEIVVINDGSSDRTETFARSSNDARVSVFTQQNAGAAAARNRGLQESRGEMVQFLDADDILAPDKIELQLEALGSMGSDAIASCQWGRFSASVDNAEFRPEPVWQISDPVQWLVQSFAGGGMMQPAAWLTPRSIADAAGPWNEALTLHDDGEYFTRVLLRSRRNEFVPAARVYYRDVPESLSRRRGRSAIESAFAVCRARAEHLLAVRSDVEARRALATQYAQFAYEYMTSAGDLTNDALKEIRLLDARPHALAGSLPFKALTMLAGFDTALRIRRTLLA